MKDPILERNLISVNFAISVLANPAICMCMKDPTLERRLISVKPVTSGLAQQEA